MYSCTSITFWDGETNVLSPNVLDRPEIIELADEQITCAYMMGLHSGHSNKMCIRYIDKEDEGDYEYKIRVEKLDTAHESTSNPKRPFPIITKLINSINRRHKELVETCIFYESNKGIFSIGKLIDGFLVYKSHIKTDLANAGNPDYELVMELFIVHDNYAPDDDSFGQIFYMYKGSDPELKASNEQFRDKLLRAHPIMIEKIKRLVEDHDSDDEPIDMDDLDRLIDPYDHVLYAEVPMTQEIIEKLN